MIKTGPFLFALAAAGLASADQVTLKNGDRVTGAVLKSDAKALTLKSEFAGTVNIDWNAVDSINSAEPLYLTLKNGQVLVGLLETSNGVIQVKTADHGTVPAPKDQVDAIRSQQEQATVEKYRNPGWLDLWAGFVETGLSLSRGNSDSTTFNLGLNATRATKRDKLTVDMASLYTTNVTNNIHALAADTVRGAVRYDFNISDRAFAFGFTNLQYDRLQHLDVRAVAGGGFGEHLIKHERTTFDFFGGASLNEEVYSNLSRTSGEVVVGEEFTRKLSKTTILNERLTLYPNVTELGEYRATFTGSAVTSISKWLSYHLTFSDIYVSNPPFGIKKNDALLSTGIRVTFAR